MGKGLSFPEIAIYVCTGSKCGKKGGKHLSKELKSLIKDNELRGEVEVIKTECTDRCKYAPVLSIQPANKWMAMYSEDDARKILKIAVDGEVPEKQ
jgi:NADH:ubiquinone oxidoreductase subunit E